MLLGLLNDGYSIALQIITLTDTIPGIAAHLFIGGLFSILGFGLWLSRRTEGSWRWAITAAVVDISIVVVIVVYGIVDAVN